jgi:opacity protein-like surface antigen
MKIHCLFTVLFFTLVSVHSQSRFGLTAGYANANAKLTSFGETDKDSEAGFYAGLVIDNKLTEVVNLQVELTYLNVKDLSFLQLPMMVKVYIAKSPFSIQGGLQITYTLEEIFDDFTKFNIGFGGGLAYDISEAFFVEGRYIFQLNDYYTGPNNAIESKINFLNIGFGYKF